MDFALRLGAASHESARTIIPARAIVEAEMIFSSGLDCFREKEIVPYILKMESS
jgi:hypothetical protein